VSTKKFFIHGVPDCPKIWAPLIQELGLSEDDYTAPSLPGFESTPPKGFDRTKDAYVDYLIQKIEDVHTTSGPVDIVGHDWGGLLTLRITGVRPDLVRTWAVVNAAYAPKRTGHRAAKTWAVPVLGELFMMAITPKRLRAMAIRANMPLEMVEISVDLWKRGHIKKSIIGLYRSANGLNWIGSPWVDTLETLPKPGLVLWGADDPFGPVEGGRYWAETYGFPFVQIDQAGHWVIAEKPEAIAPALTKHWQRNDTKSE
jgi:pimeloyl-ACP methyl ester carboxylesterase